VKKLGKNGRYATGLAPWRASIGRDLNAGAGGRDSPEYGFPGWDAVRRTIRLGFQIWRIDGIR